MQFHQNETEPAQAPPAAALGLQLQALDSEKETQRRARKAVALSAAAFCFEKGLPLTAVRKELVQKRGELLDQLREIVTEERRRHACRQLFADHLEHVVQPLEQFRDFVEKGFACEVCERAKKPKLECSCAVKPKLRALGERSDFRPKAESGVVALEVPYNGGEVGRGRGADD